MAHQPLDRAKRYHDAIRAALLNEWDPIGVADIPEAQGEYDAYVGSLFKLLVHRAPTERIFEYLWWLEIEHMGLTGDQQRTRQFAERLGRLPAEIDESDGGARS